MSIPDSEQVLRLDEDFTSDPYRVYDDLRVGPPRRAVFPRGTRGWLLTRYADVRAALADPTLSKDVAGAAPLLEKHRDADAPEGGFAPELAAHMLNTDPPDHTRLRKLVNRAFTVRGVESMRPRVEEITAGLLDAMAAGPADVDLLSAFAFPLPMTVICEVLGVPDHDRDEFRKWTGVLVSSSKPEDLQTAGPWMVQYLVSLIAEKRSHPGPDLLTALIEASEDDDRLSENELVAMAFLLLVAGHETTVNLVGNGLLALLRDPDQLAALRADPSLLPAAVEEFLRYDGPVNIASFRYTTQPVTFGDTTIPEGEFLFLALGAANRDPDRFPDPDRLDLTRPTSGHMAFGHGIHYCVGAPLARMEAEVALRGLLERFPDIALGDGELRYRNSPIIRGLEEFPIRLR
ncbi:cytochrome P450 [Actinokineospora soli]|uniref:Cytochrome P450 n=1 Tax=Actinokineospora soli TaxID=1048753 RepID=A0ABW2TSE4_9PSEU